MVNLDGIIVTVSLRLCIALRKPFQIELERSQDPAHIEMESRVGQNHHGLRTCHLPTRQ